MSNSRFTLKEFINPIPTCGQTANLPTILNLLNSSQSGKVCSPGALARGSLSSSAIAVLNEEEFPIGIIDSDSLLSFLSNKLLNSWTVVHHLSKLSGAAASKSIDICSSLFDLQSLIKPTIILTSELSRENFLSQLESETHLINNQVSYLVVDSGGKLLGKLNSQKLMRSLILDCSDLNNNNFSLTKVLPKFYFNLIEQIPIPLSIQTRQGNILYRNQVWREQINLAQEINWDFSNSNSFNSIPQSSEKISEQFQLESIKLDPYCLKSNSYLFKSPSSLLPTQNGQLLELMEEVNSQLVKDAQKNTIIQQLWNYYRLPLNDSGFSYWLVLAVQSLTKEQEKLTQPQSDLESEQLNQLKDEFLSHISHELKSPLTAIVGLSSLLKEQKLGQLNQRQTRYADLIYRGGRKLINVVNDLLDLTRLTTNKISLNLEQIEIKTFCEAIYQQLINKLEDNITSVTASNYYPQLKFKIESEIIIGDKVRLNQILSRLFKAALKVIPSQPEIGIAVKKWQNWIAITVWNSKSIFSEYSQHLAWEVSLQSQTSITNPQKEVELDLMLAQQIAKSYGGNISCLSQIDDGSEFTLLIPNQNCNYNLNLESNDIPIVTEHNLRILIGETNPNRINELTNQLIDFGYQPVIACTGIEILEKARQLQPSKILINGFLPLLTIDDILTLLKADVRTQKIPVFILKNNGDELVINNTQLVAGCLDFPLQRSALLQIFELVKSEVVQKKRLTILSLHPNCNINDQSITSVNSELDFSLKAGLDHLDHRIIEADCLEQGELLARIWQIDAILIDGSVLDEPVSFLRSLKNSRVLATLPLVTLDAKTTAAANQIEGLSVFPCLVPAEERTIMDLAQVIQIAAGIN
ncbi:histidine kinase [Stanieria sp. NIES-3757]|nr:histidine kinase [Stanieria sp. NIES-3757]